MSPPFSIATEMARQYEKINAVRQRVWILTFLRGMTGAAQYWLASLLTFGALNLLYPFPPSIRLAFLLFHVILVGFGFIRGVRRSGEGGKSIRGRRLRAWALRCEELFPILQNRLVTCVEIAEEEDGEETFRTNPVANALLRQTSIQFEGFQPSRAIPTRKFFRALLFFTLPFLTLFMLFAAFDSWTNRAVFSLYNLDRPVQSASPFFVNDGELLEFIVLPGAIEVPRGSTVDIRAAIRFSGSMGLKETPAAEILEWTTENAEAEEKPFESFTMTESTPWPEEGDDSPASRTFQLALNALTRSVDYKVRLKVGGLDDPEADGKESLLDRVRRRVRERDREVVSELFRLTPYDPPNIESIHSLVAPPAYTRLSAEEIEGTYIAGLAGSTVTLRAQSNAPLASARLMDENGKTIESSILDGAYAEFEFPLGEKKSFHLEITDTSRHSNVDPPLIVIAPRPDRPPKITVKRPGADWSVHRVAEVTLEAEASDDYGLRELLLEYRLNDQPATTITLYADPGVAAAPIRDRRASELLELEELDLEVGDSIVYQFVARDMRPDDAAGSAYSQPYFLTVRPFDKVFYKGEAQKSGGGGGGGSAPPDQRDVIVATMRAITLEKGLDDIKRGDLFQDLSETQRAVRRMTEAQYEKMADRFEIDNLDKRLEHLDNAIGQMKKAEQILQAEAPRQALPSENSALRHLTAALAGLPQTINWPEGTPPPSDALSDPPIELSAQRLDMEKDPPGDMNETDPGST